MPNATNVLIYGLMRALAASFRWRPRLREYLRDRDGWMNFSVGYRTLDDAVQGCVVFREGRVEVHRRVLPDADTVMHFKNAGVVRRMLTLPPNEVMDLLLHNELALTGNLALMSKFNFFLSLLMEKRNRKTLAAMRAARSGNGHPGGNGNGRPAIVERLRGEATDAVAHLVEPNLAEWSLDDFPRLREFQRNHHEHKPAICAERARLYTQWHREHGFDADRDGRPWAPDLRQALALKHVLENKRAIIRRNDLLPGTTTAEEIGVVLYPETHGTMIWGELLTAPDRPLNPYDVAPETRAVLHRDVFPYWERRNIREWVRTQHGEPLGQKLDERFAVYFVWKTVGVSHTIPDFPKLLRSGTAGMAAEIEAALAKAEPADTERRTLFQAMLATLAGLENYASRLAAQAAKEAEVESDPVRREELREIAAASARVPRLPARTLHEALTAVWLAWVAIHMENTNTGMSLGRLDTWLQPYFAADMEQCADEGERRACVKRAVELVGCFYMRCTDHLPLVPDIGNFLFGGSSSDQAITLGGVTPAGESAVCDMTYVFLKATELLAIRDPNVNARFHPGVNSDAYLRRLCEVNLITAATPSMHNDRAVMAALDDFNCPDEHRRDWSATGCVEPTISGRHMGHTGCIMMNMVAALEMALRDGRHPLMAWDVGPHTGRADSFASFEDFYRAFEAQLGFLMDQACEYNDLLGVAHGKLRPTPLLSTLIEGPLEKGVDVSRGGARYNSTGMACIGLADVTDSLMAIERLVFDEKKLTLTDMCAALDRNFEGDEALRAQIVGRVAKFGSGDPAALAMAQRVAQFAHDHCRARTNYRGGHYSAGFWSMSNHVAFGTLAGALPSGRAAGKAFTPGLTPQPAASEHLLDPLRDVASLDPKTLTNNIAFNVKFSPGSGESHARAVEHVFNYVKAYFDMGGMQLQFNIVTSAMLRDAMAHPDDYRHLLVRISGYNAYFVTLNRDMQLELIERAEYGVG